MSRFLLAVWGFETHLNPNLALAHALRERGHDVAFYTASEVIGMEGFDFFPFAELEQKRADRLVHAILANRKRPYLQKSLWKQFLVGSIGAQIGDLTQIVNRWKPDVIVSDMTLWGPILTRELWNVPVAVLSHIGYSMHPGRFGPVPGICLPPRKRLDMTVVRSILRCLYTLATADMTRAMNQVRIRYSLAPVGLRMAEYYSRMPLVLIPGSRSLDYSRRDLPDSIHYIGACVWPAIPRIRAASGPRPRVVVEEGALFPRQATMLSTALQVAGRLDAAVTLMAGKGRSNFQTDRAQLPPNVSIRRWAPLCEWIAETDVLVTRGNTESIMAALCLGIPLVVVPSILDQAEMAARVQSSGAGLRLSESRCTPETLYTAMQQVLQLPCFRKAAERQAEILQQLHGPALAADLLDRLTRHKHGSKDLVSGGTAGLQ